MDLSNQQPLTGQCVNNTYSLDGYTPMTRNLQGRSHMVVPCTLIVEGVHNGNQGPMFYSTTVISQHALEWNGVPVTLMHTTDHQGSPELCAADPSIYDRFVIGRVFNARADGARLRAELWIDVNRARELDANLVNRLQRGDPIEVSTGLLPISLTANGGIWQNEEYSAEVLSLRPDHLAILPNDCGACSLLDGCGIRNRKEDDNVLRKPSKDLKQQMSEFLIGNGQGMIEKFQLLSSYLDGMDSGESVHFLEEAHEGEMIYRVVSHAGTATRMEQFFKVSYTINDDNTIELGTPSPVIRDISYKPVTTNEDVESKQKQKDEEEEDPPVENKQGEKDMSEKKDKPVENAGCPCSDKPDEAVAANATSADPTPAPAAPAVTNKVEKEELTLNEFLAKLPSDTRDFVESGLALHNQKKTQLIEGIVNASGNQFTAEELSGKQMGELEKINNLIRPASDQDNVIQMPTIYPGQMGAPVDNASNDEPLGVPSLADIFKKAK